MKKFCSVAVCSMFILTLAYFAYGRSRSDMPIGDSSVSVDTTTSSTISQPSSASDTGYKVSGSISVADTASSSAQVSQTPGAMSVSSSTATAPAKSKKKKRGPKAKEGAAVSAAAAQPSMTAASGMEGQASNVSPGSDDQAKANALQRALQASGGTSSVESSASQPVAVAVEPSSEQTRDQSYAADDRARAEAEAKAAEAETAAVASKAQKPAKAVSSAPAPKVAKGGFAPFYVYKDQGARENHYIASGWMGDYGDLKINTGCTTKVHSGTTSFQVKYNAKMAQNAGWCGIYWQSPPNNWGDKKGGYNLTGAKKLTFWACGEKGGEIISEFKMGGISGEYPDSDSASIGPIELSKKWQQYTIDLTGRDLTNIIGGFCFSASRDDNPEGFTIYLDDIVYE